MANELPEEFEVVALSTEEEAEEEEEEEDVAVVDVSERADLPLLLV